MACEAILQYTVAKGLSYKVLKAEKRCFLISCCSESCPFRLRVSLNKNQQEIKTTISIPHKCRLETHYDWRPSKSMKYLKPHHQNTFNNDHTIKPKQIIAIEKAAGKWKPQLLQHMLAMTCFYGCLNSHAHP